MLREIFRDYDKERRGSINRKAFQSQVGESHGGLLKAFSSAMFDAADKNHNEEIDLCEFLQMYVPHLSRHHAVSMCDKWGGALYKEDRLERRKLRLLLHKLPQHAFAPLPCLGPHLNVRA